MEKICVLEVGRTSRFETMSTTSICPTTFQGGVSDLQRENRIVRHYRCPQFVHLVNVVFPLIFIDTISAQLYINIPWYIVKTHNNTYLITSF